MHPKRLLVGKVGAGRGQLWLVWPAKSSASPSPKSSRAPPAAGVPCRRQPAPSAV